MIPQQTLFKGSHMQIKVGDRIGIGSTKKKKKTTDLYCHVVNIADAGITFDVINGAWTGLLRPDGVIVIGTKPINKEHRSEVLYVFRPSEPHMHYNDALYYMDDELAKRFRIRTYVDWKLYTIKLRVNAFRQWLSDIIAPPSNKRSSKYNVWDDDIPF